MKKFGEGEYRDILGLCKVAYTNDEFKTGDEDSISIEEKGVVTYSRSICWCGTC